MNDETHLRMTSATLTQGSVEVRWADDRVIALDALWLRDNCGCADCRHAETQERTFDISTLPESLGVTSAAISDSGELRLVWDFDGHVSSYAADWLASHIGPPEANDEAPAVAPGAALTSASHSTVAAGGEGLLGWLRALRDEGIARVREVPVEPKTVIEFARHISYPRPTNFGVHFDVESVPRPNSNAYTALRVNPHTDPPNWAEPPGFQFLHCLENEAPGGESLFVDGFGVARTLRRDDADAFDLLARTPLDFRYHDADTDIRCRPSPPTVAAA